MKKYFCDADCAEVSGRWIIVMNINLLPPLLPLSPLPFLLLMMGENKNML